MSYIHTSRLSTHREGALFIVWQWVMKQIKHALNMQQLIFLYWLFHDDTAVGLDGRSYESIVREMFDRVYDGAATAFIMKFCDTHGNDVNDEWMTLYFDVQCMILELKLFIDDKNKADTHHNNNINKAKTRKRKRESADAQAHPNSTKRRRRRSSLTF